jgi:hypothetical protein
MPDRPARKGTNLVDLISHPAGDRRTRHRKLSSSVSVAATATATMTTTTATAGTLTILRLIDLEGAAVKVRAVQRLHGAGRIGIRHLHETETTWASRVTVSDQGDALDGSMLREQSAHRIIGGGKREISNI